MTLKELQDLYSLIELPNQAEAQRIADATTKYFYSSFRNSSVKIEWIHRDTPRRLGTAYSDGRIKLFCRNGDNPTYATLAHELAHFLHWYHGPEHRACIVRVFQFWAEKGV